MVEFFSMLLFITKGNNWKMFYVGFWYTTMNATLIIYFLPVMHIYGRHISSCSIISILLPFGIKSMLIIWSLSSSTIIIGDTWWITRMTITFLRDFNILAKWWKLFIICRPGTNNFNLIVFHWNFFHTYYSYCNSMMHNYIWISFGCRIWTSLTWIILKSWYEK